MTFEIFYHHRNARLKKILRGFKLYNSWFFETSVKKTAKLCQGTLDMSIKLNQYGQVENPVVLNTDKCNATRV